MLRLLPRSDVRLLEGQIKRRQSLTGRYLLDLDAGRLLHNFRVNAALPSAALPLGGWESPGCGLRGHFVGHYLSACAQMYASTGEAAFQLRAERLVAELGKCQLALGGDYLSAFPATQFDLLERDFGGAWAPYYTLHKILAGLLDAARDAGSDDARDIASRLGDWVAGRIRRLPPDRLEPLLRTSDLNPLNEYGGIGEAMYDLYALTGKPEHLETAKLFDRDWFLRPLIEGRDILAGLHANTHIPQALAAARRYEITGEEDYRRAVEFFWERTALARSYVNGGSSGPRPDRRERSEGGEHWPDAFNLRGSLTPKSNESCVAHNMTRLTDKIFAWRADCRSAEFRERIFFNSVLAVQHPGYPGGYVYSHPLAPGSRKVFGDFDNTFWCCYGTSVEAYARLADGIYFDDGDDLWVSQFVASEATWRKKGARIIQHTGFPTEQSTRLTIHCDHAKEFTLHVRVPTWARGARWRVTGVAGGATGDGAGAGDGAGGERRGGDRAGNGTGDGDFLSIRRIWRDGDMIDLTLPMSLRFEPLPGDDREIAFVYGPAVLAARTPHALELGVASSAALASTRGPAEAEGNFSVRLAFGGEVPLVPVSQIVDEAFGVYFKVTGGS